MDFKYTLVAQHADEISSDTDAGITSDVDNSQIYMPSGSFGFVASFVILGLSVFGMVAVGLAVEHYGGLTQSSETMSNVVDLFLQRSNLSQTTTSMPITTQSTTLGRTIPKFSPPCTTTPSLETCVAVVGPHVYLQLQIDYLHYRSLVASPMMMSEFKAAVRTGIVRASGHPPPHLTSFQNMCLSLAPGPDVIVEARVAPDVSAGPTALVAQNLSAKLKPQVCSFVVAALDKLAVLGPIITGVVVGCSVLGNEVAAAESLASMALTHKITPGAKEITVSRTDACNIGQTVLIASHTSFQEVNTIIGCSSSTITLQYAVNQEHGVGTIIETYADGLTPITTSISTTTSIPGNTFQWPELSNSERVAAMFVRTGAKMLFREHST